MKGDSPFTDSGSIMARRVITLDSVQRGIPRQGWPQQRKKRAGPVTPWTLEHEFRAVSGGFRICTVSCQLKNKTPNARAAPAISLLVGVRDLFSNSLTRLLRCAVLAPSWQAHCSAAAVPHVVFRVRESNCRICSTGYRSNDPVETTPPYSQQTPISHTSSRLVWQVRSH